MLKLKKRNSKKIKWGVAGLGVYSENTFIPNLFLVRKAKLVSVYSSDKVRTKSIATKFSVSEHYDDFDAFLKSDIDAVYIGSANSNHYNQVIKAALAGKHILCDKPIALSSSEAEEMVQVCKENNVKFAVNYVYRFHPIIIKLKEMIDSNIIGKIININCQFAIDFSPNDNFRYNKSLSGGGAIRDLATHLVDLLRFLGGEIIEIDGCIDNLVYKSQVDDFVFGTVKFEKGHYGYFNSAFCSKRAFNRIEITGSTGSICIDNLIAAKFPQTAKMTILLQNESKKVFRARGNKVFHIIKSVNDSFLKNTEPEVTGIDGLINLKLLELLEEKCHQKKS